MERKMSPLRGRLTKPSTLLFTNREAYKFHEKCGVVPLWEKHCRPVLTKAQETTIVEQDIIENPQSDVYRAWVNSVIAEIINYHLVDYRALRENRMELPPALRDERVLQELELFGKLTALDRKGAPLSEYVPLLNNGDAPLALLAKIADVAITHTQHNILSDFVSNVPHPLFRLYPSYQKAIEAMSADAKAGMQVYAPLAELFGHPTIAGDIFIHAFHVCHPDVYKFVIDQLNNGEIQEKISFTQEIVKLLIKKIESDLKKAGFGCVVTPRWKKHEGKMMNKIRNGFVEEYKNSEASNLISLKDYVSRRFESYAITELHDIVAARVVLDTYKENSIDEMEDEEKKTVIDEANKIIKKHLDILIYSSGNAYVYDHKFYNKENGYRSHHFDVKPVTIRNSTNFEFQLRTREWHEVSEHGKAAHYYYIGGDSEFVQIIKFAYKDRVYIFKKAA